MFASISPKFIYNIIGILLVTASVALGIELLFQLDYQGRLTLPYLFSYFALNLMIWGCGVYSLNKATYFR